MTLATGLMPGHVVAGETAVAGSIIKETLLTTGIEFTTQAATTKMLVYGVGGGGGGGGANNVSVGAGGASGAFCQKLFTVTGSTAYAYAIGAGGIAGNGTSGANGGAGGDNTFTVGATTITAKGGGGGQTDTTGYPGAHVGGAPGTSTNGDLNGVGNRGQSGFVFVAGETTLLWSGSGGSSPYGSGGNALDDGAGVAGTGYGAAGGGAAEDAASAKNGGVGTQGFWMVIEFA